MAEAKWRPQSMCAFLWVYVRIYVRVNVRVCVRVHVRVYVRVYVRVHVRVHQKHVVTWKVDVLQSRCCGRSSLMVPCGGRFESLVFECVSEVFVLEGRCLGMFLS